MRRAILGSLVAVAVTVVPFVGLAQQAPPAGLVTTLNGQATVTRASAPALPLRFKDDVFLRDRIATRENSLVRMLLGGKALVTVRELSALTITEEAGRSTVEMDTGKIAVGVARQRMRPGETIEIRTPNAVATVRGTVLVVEVMRATAQVGGGAAPAVSTVNVLSGSVDFFLRGAPGNVVTVGPMQSLSATGGTLGQVRAIPPGALAQIMRGLKADLQHRNAPASTLQSVGDSAESNALALASTLTGAPVGAGTRGLVTPLTHGGRLDVPVLATTGNEDTLNPTSSGTTALTPIGRTTLVNGGFESGAFPPGWSTEGAASVISQFGTITPPGGSYFALVHTGSGAVVNPSCTSGQCSRSSIKQSFDVTSAVHVRFRVTLMSNEYPDFTNTGSTFNDRFIVDLHDASGQTRTVYSTTVNAQDDAFNSNPTVASAGGFTLETNAGIVDLGEISTTLVAAAGPATLTFNIFNVDDNAYDSAVLIDMVNVTQDPPLLGLLDGSAFTWDSAVHVVAGGIERFDSLLLVANGSVATLRAPLLEAVDADVTAPFSLLTVTQGGTVVSLSADPLVRLRGGTYALGTSVAVFDVSGVNAALDPETGLVLGTDRPLRHAGTFLEAVSAAIETRSVLRIDTALLEASRPLLDLKAGSVLTASGPVVDMGIKSRVTSLGPLVRLDASTLKTAGAIVSINGGALTGSGPLLSLANGSRISAFSLASVRNGVFSWSGPLAQFSGSGNSVTFTNNLCASASCVTVGGLRFALRDGATAGNIVVTNGTPWAGTGGTVNVPANGAVFDVRGATSRVSIR